mgnify:CR=1 FL=1
MSITSIVAGKLAARAVETTLLRDTEDGLRTPIGSAWHGRAQEPSRSTRWNVMARLSRCSWAVRPRSEVDHEEERALVHVFALSGRQRRAQR